MSILYNKTGVIRTRTVNAKQVKTRVVGDTIDCKIEPVQDVSDLWFDSASVFEVYQIFTDNTSIEVSNKIVIDSVSYIVKWIKKRDGKLRSYSICFVVKSQWT